MNISDLSVLLTVYNSAPYVGAAIRSVLKQTFHRIEVVIINDGSTDDTDAEIKKFNDPRIRYFCYQHLGRSRALNEGLRLCRHEWTALMDADDLWHPRKLELQLKGGITGSYDIILCNAVYFQNSVPLYLIRVPGNKKELLKILALHGHIATPSVIYNRLKILEEGGYDECLPTAEDYDLWLRLKDRFNFIAVPEFLVYIRENPGSLSRSNIRERNRIIFSLQDRYYNNLRDNFGITDASEEIKIRGWRYFFYGDSKKARQQWRNLGFSLLREPRIFLAYIFSFLSENRLNMLKEKRFKLKIDLIISKILGLYREDETVAEILRNS